MFEKSWLPVAPQAFTADGGVGGLISIADTAGFKVKAQVVISASGLPNLTLQCKRVISKTQLLVGQIGQNINSKADVSAYTVLLGAFIYQDAQSRVALPPPDILQAVYEQEPTVAIRTVQVDQYGNIYDENNPLPISFDGTVQVGDVSIVEGGNTLKVNADGSINVDVNGQTGGGSSQDIIIEYGEVTSVSSGVTTNVINYTVPIGGIYTLQRVLFSGENTGKYQLIINSSVVATSRTYFGGSLDGIINLSGATNEGYIVNGGDVIQLTVLHNRPYTADFECTLELIQGENPAVGTNFRAIYNESLAVVSGSPVTLLTYTVMPSITSKVQRILFSGENIAKYQVFVNSVAISTKRTYFGSSLNGVFEFTGNSGGGLNMNAGDILLVQVSHQRPYPGDFEATLEVIET
jgi:hypothetical protein